MRRGHALAMVVIGSVAAVLNLVVLAMSDGNSGVALSSGVGAAATIVIAVLGARHLARSRDE